MDRAAALAGALVARGGPHLPAVEWTESVVSTSDRLKALARAGAPAWTAVLADRQTGGRGRDGRPWASPSGGLYLSVLLRPRHERVSLLPLAAGVAVAEAVGELGVTTELKWPNDVLVSGRKVAGILSEAVSGSAGVEWVVLGIGVNVALDAGELPPEIAGNATSLRAEGATVPSLPSFAAAVLARLRASYDGLGSAPDAVVSAWRSRAARWWGAMLEIRSGDVTLRGRLSDVDDEGALVVELEGGGKRRLLSGEISRVRPAGS
jgi:BirA family transcriptional regulator, biotin operon repressor / biotin---[acetyl-CoA-carboxylase] ligase